MEWLQNNWFWIALSVGFIAMHMFGHGGHRHGHGSVRKDGRQNPFPANNTSAESEAEITHLNASASPTAGSNNSAPRGAPAHAGHADSRHRHSC